MVDLLDAGWFAVNVFAGQIAQKALEPAVERTWRAIMAVLLPLYDPALASVRLNLQEHIERERAKDQEFSEKLERSMRAGEPEALVAHFVREAAQATTEERMRMLAAAAAGVLVPDLDSEMRSRVARAVAQLEPGDVVVLRRMREYLFQGSSDSVARSLGPSRGALEASGCVLVRTSDDDLRRALNEVLEYGHQEVRTLASVSDVGHAVLRALAIWRPTAAKA